jgi:hypothetical protein
LPIEGGPPLKVFDASTIFGLLLLARESDGFFYINGRTGLFEFQALASGPPRKLLDPKASRSSLSTSHGMASNWSTTRARRGHVVARSDQ